MHTITIRGPKCGLKYSLPKTKLHSSGCLPIKRNIFKRRNMCARHEPNVQQLNNNKSCRTRRLQNLRRLNSHLPVPETSQSIEEWKKRKSISSPFSLSQLLFALLNFWRAAFRKPNWRRRNNTTEPPNPKWSTKWATIKWRHFWYGTDMQMM